MLTNSSYQSFNDKNMSMNRNINNINNALNSYQPIMRTSNKEKLEIFPDALSFLFNSITSNQDIIKILTKLGLYLKDFYEYYSNENGNMTFLHFFNFYKNFSLFPDLINLVQMKNLFCFLTEKKKYVFIINSNNNSKKKKGDKNNKKLINNNDLNIEDHNLLTFDKFLISLSISSFLFDFDNNFSSVDKILYLVEKMNQSSGKKNCQMKIGRTFKHNYDLSTFYIQIKKEFPNAFEKIKEKNKENKIKRKELDNYYNLKINEDKKEDNKKLKRLEDIYDEG